MKMAFSMSGNMSGMKSLSVAQSLLPLAGGDVGLVDDGEDEA